MGYVSPLWAATGLPLSTADAAAQPIEPGFASRTAAGFAAALAPCLGAAAALRSAAGVAVAIAMTATPGAASRSTSAFAVALEPAVAPSPAARTSSAWATAMAQVATPGAASRSTSASAVALAQHARPSSASLTSAAWVTAIRQVATPDAAPRSCTGLAPGIAQSVVLELTERTPEALPVSLATTATPAPATSDAQAWAPWLSSATELDIAFASRAALAWRTSGYAHTLGAVGVVEIDQAPTHAVRLAVIAAATAAASCEQADAARGGPPTATVSATVAAPALPRKATAETIMATYRIGQTVTLRCTFSSTPASVELRVRFGGDAETVYTDATSGDGLTFSRDVVVRAAGVRMSYYWIGTWADGSTAVDEASLTSEPSAFA